MWATIARRDFSIKRTPLRVSLTDPKRQLAFFGRDANVEDPKLI
jgi:hypothetical protein